MDWDECRTQRIVKDVPADEELARALIRQAQNRRASAERLELDEISASTLITLWYDVIRLHLESATARSGAKVYNHACYVGFARTVLEDDTLAAGFDTLRLIRNGVLYYAEDATIEQAKRFRSEVERLVARI